MRMAITNDINKNWLNKAILIYGPRKSGTTLTQSLLDGGNELLMRPGELKMKFFVSEVWSDSENAHKEFLKKRRKLGSFNGFNDVTYTQFVQKTVDYSPSLNRLMKDEMETILQSLENRPNDLKCWGAKEAGGDIHQIMSLWKSLFFDGKMIFVIRDPLMVVRSILTDARKNGQFMNWRRIRKEIKTVLRSLRRMQSHMNEPYVHTVIYEKLTSDTVHTVNELCKFLELTLDERHYYPTVFGINVSVRTSSKKKKKVFQSEKKWFHDLTFRERFFILLFYFLHKRVHYKKVVKKAEEGNR